MGNTCEISSLSDYIDNMSKGDIIIVQKHCNMQITNLAFTFDIFTSPTPQKTNNPPPKKKNNNVQFKLQTLTFESKIKMVFF